MVGVWAKWGDFKVIWNQVPSEVQESENIVRWISDYSQAQVLQNIKKNQRWK